MGPFEPPQHLFKQFFVTNKLQYLSLFQTAHSSEVSLLKLPASLGLRLVIFSSQHQFTFEQKQIVPSTTYPSTVPTFNSLPSLCTDFASLMGALEI